MNFIYYRTHEVEYEIINRTIIDGNFSNISLIISKVNYGDIYADDTSCHVTTLSDFPHIHIPLKNNLSYMDKSFHTENVIQRNLLFPNNYQF